MTVPYPLFDSTAPFVDAMIIPAGSSAMELPRTSRAIAASGVAVTVSVRFINSTNNISIALSTNEGPIPMNITHISVGSTGPAIVFF